MARNTRVGAPLSRRSALRLGSALAVGALTLTACSDSGSGDDAGSGTKSKLTTVTFALDFLPNPTHSGLAYAMQKGLFEKQGIKLKILPVGSTASDALISAGQADAGFTSNYATALTTVAAGAPLKAIFSAMSQDPSAVTVLKSSGITSPAQLAGKVYGGYGSPLEIAIINAMITDAGGKGKVKPVVLQVGSTDALKTKKVDMAVTWPDQEYNFAQSGVKYKSFVSTDYGVPQVSGLLTLASNSFLQKDPEVARGLVKALSEGYQGAIDDPKGATKALMAQFPNANINEKVADYVSTREAKSLLNPYGPIGTQSVKKWQTYADWMIEQGVLAGPNGKPLKKFDATSLVTNAYVPK
ncbi:MULTISPECIES: ABC transporter substrate-binding protein [unclassified Streptomyces]|uniref:ABC transporter substrate-binding protein n=1 Tax=unclassified Streptomyces TaxID=2593676 RepID=UPI003400F9F0